MAATLEANEIMTMSNGHTRAAPRLPMVCLLLSSLVSTFATAAAPEAESLTPKQQEGKQLFGATCIYCHNPRGYATERLKARNGEDRSVLAQRTDLDAAYIRTVVRNGLISMPAYTPTDLSEAQIQAIAAYLTRNAKR